MNLSQWTGACILLAAAGAAMAQPRGPGGPCAAGPGASGPAASASAPGPGGCGRMGPRAMSGRDVTPGWQMMSREERRAHRERMAGFKTQDECRSYMDRHHQDMVARAKERGQAMPAQPRRDACAPLKDKPAK